MARKKNFSDNPALQFISSADDEGAPDIPAAQAQAADAGSVERDPFDGKTLTQIMNEAPEGYKLNPLYVERRTRRVQLVFTQSSYDALKSMSRETGRSVNDMVNQAVEEFLQREKEGGATNGR